MSFIFRLIAKVLDSISGGANRNSDSSIVADNQANFSQDRSIGSGRDFDADYRAALRLLRDRIDRKFPDGHYAKLRSGISTPHDHGENRAQAVNMMSTAVAMALRNGATVQQAADAGAASVGI